MDQELSIRQDQQGDILILRISGKLDFLSTSLLEDTLKQILNQSKNKLVLDLSNVSYISSPGLKLLLELSKRLKALSGKFVIFGLQPFPLEIIKDTNFDVFLEITETEQEALAKFS